MDELDETVPDFMKEADNNYWIVSSLSSFLDLSVKNRQDKELGSLMGNSPYLESTRVIKANKPIPKVYLELHKIDFVVLGGIYLEMPVVIVNSSLKEEMDEVVSNKDFIENYNLPVGYHYGTRQFTFDGYMVSLGYNEICPKYLNYSSDWEYFQLS